MYIFSKLTPVIVTGKVDIKVYDCEDLAMLEPKVDQIFDNSTAEPLLESLTDVMHSSSGNTAFQLNSSTNWFTGNDAGNNPSGTDTDRDGEDGILAIGNQTTGYVDDPYNGTHPIKEFFLHASTSTSVLANVATWVAQAVWNVSPANDNTISSLEIGKNYNGGYQETTFDTAEFATADSFSSFVLEEDDILKVTWTMTIG